MNRIKQLRDEFNITQEELAKKLDLSKGIISLYEKEERKPSLEILIKLSEIFNCSIDYLLGKSDIRNPKKITHYDKQDIINGIMAASGLKFKDNFKDICKFSLKDNKFYMCPLYGKISAGEPNWAEECIEGYLPIDSELMGIINPEEHYFLRVNGESMNKVIKNGAFALIHKQDYVDNGEIAVVLVNGDCATLKRFSKQGDIIVLTPESTDDSFQQQIYTENTPIKVIGKYVGKMEINK